MSEPITEDIVSFETAKLLKEKGFPQDYDEYNSLVYNEEDYEDEYEVQRMILETCLVKAGTLSPYPLGVPDPKCYCPTVGMVMKWLREKGWFICIIPLAFYGGEKASKFGYNIWADDNLEVDEFDTPVFYTYEDACNAAINYCLKYLN